jgi:hypothetical protein
MFKFIDRVIDAIIRWFETPEQKKKREQREFEQAVDDCTE